MRGESQFIIPNVIRDFDKLGHIAQISQMEMSIPGSGFSCPIKFVMIFLGNDDPEQEIEKAYYGLKSRALVEAKAAEMGHKVHLSEKTEGYEAVVFDM